jgi:hypothetical protein
VVSADPRFALEWLLPLEPGLSTHVTLMDNRVSPREVVAIGHGADEIDALLELWRVVSDRQELSEAKPVVTSAYRRRTGRDPEQSNAEIDA